ncbi:MAG: tetratricopeptide repeat protein [Luteolibacter sp.]
MASEQTHPPATPARLPVFPIACWALGATAFSQLLIAGMALSQRFEESKQVRIVEKEVPKLVAVRLPPTQEEIEKAAVRTRPPAIPYTPPAEPIVQPTPVDAPKIADPRSETLVKAGRRARVAGDMGTAIVKLEEALAQSPDDASVLYELGLVHEQMGVFDKASEYYQKVFEKGISGAGSLYEMAAAKLRDGFEQPTDWLGKISLGRVRIFKDTTREGDERVILTVPVQKAPAEEVDVNEIEVSVIFFNRTNKGEIVQLEDKSWVSQQWVSLPFDWAGGEENLRLNYTIPVLDEGNAHLFGQQKYYGQVVSLLYKGEVLDVQAWPRDLAARIPRSPIPQAAAQSPDFMDQPPPDFDPNNPSVLPPLPSAPPSH